MTEQQVCQIAEELGKKAQDAGPCLGSPPLSEVLIAALNAELGLCRQEDRAALLRDIAACWGVR